MTVKGGRAARMEGDSRSGAILAVVVLLTLALFGLAHGLLVSAETAYGVARARARLVGLEARATGALHHELAGGWQTWMDSVAVGGQRSVVDPVGVGSPTTRVHRRIGAEAWLMESVATSGEARAGVRRLVWLYDPATRVGALPGVASVASGAPVAVQGTIVPDAVPAVGVIGEPRLGRLDLQDMLAASDTLPSSGTPAPLERMGACDTSDPWNWGEPLRPHRPCGTHFVIRGGVGPVAVDGGQGQGVLIVDGSLTLRGGAAFQGVVIVSGALRLAGSSRVEGRALAFGGLVVESGATLRGSPALAEAALAAVRDRLASWEPLHPALTLGPG